MEKVAAKQKSRLKKSNPEQFQRFIEAARKRGMNESLEDFAIRFGSVQTMPTPTLPDK